MTELLLLPAHAPVHQHSLRVTLLGPPQITAGGMPFSLPRRQLRALVYRLAVEPQPVARDHLCFLFWPDVSDAAARRHLTVLLNQLRQALSGQSVLQVGRDAVRLDLDVVDVDTVALASAIQRAATERNVEPLRVAIDRYHGPFLDGFNLSTSAEFDAWADAERQRWERRYLDALALLVDTYAAQGAYAQAIALAQRALAVDAMGEETHRRLIELYGAAGDRSAALRQFEQCVVMLERELGVGPLPETRAIYEAVRDGHGTMPQPQSNLRRAVDALPTVDSGVERPTRLLHVPAAPNPLLGREEQLAQADALLRQPHMRLLTLCGPGGSGKTRLAQQIAWDVHDRFADGVVWVSLAVLRDPALVMQAIASACGLKQTSASSLANSLRDKHLLLVLDNCEHVLAAGPELAALLRAGSRLHILATSRSPLHLQGEHTLAVPPLPLPKLGTLPPLEALAAVPSVALLLARTKALNPQVQLTANNANDIAAICVRLDGLPLAIELAAARLRLLPPRDLLRRLDRRLAVLHDGPRDVPDRQQTLRATIDWSYRLLDTEQQRWFERYSVFSGGWSLALVEGLHEQVRWSEYSAADVLDVLGALVDKQLVQVSSTDGETRFGMLETMREFAVERLAERGAEETVARAHAESVLALLEPWDVYAPTWLANVERELDNLRVALRWFLEQPQESACALDLGLIIARFCYWRDWIGEGRFWLGKLVASCGDQRTEAYADIVNWAGLFATVDGDSAQGDALYSVAIELSRGLRLLKPRANALLGLGTMVARQGDLVRAIALLEESLAVARQLALPTQISNACYMLANVLIDDGNDIARGVGLYEECLALARQHDMTVVVSMALAGLGEVAALTGDIERAEALLPQALDLQRTMHATMAEGWTLLYLGVLRYHQAHYAAAQDLFVQSLEMVPQGGAQYIVPIALEGVAGVLCMRNHPVRAARLLGAAEALREQITLRRPPIERTFYEHILETGRAQLSDHTWDTAWKAGRGCTTAEAIAEAKTPIA